MHETSMQEHIGNYLVGFKKIGPDVVQGKKVFNKWGAGPFHRLLDQKNDDIDDDQVFDYGRDYLGTPRMEIGHIASKITGCKLMF